MVDFIAGGGILNRRALLRASGVGLAAGILAPGHTAEDWMMRGGEAPGSYGSQSDFAGLQRERVGGHTFGAGAGSSSTPLQKLNGTITPNSLHFERHHSGIPDIDPDRHALTIVGEVERPLRFNYEDLHAYPMETHVYFLECSGNSFRNSLKTAADLTAGSLSGLISCAEWTVFRCIICWMRQVSKKVQAGLLVREPMQQHLRAVSPWNISWIMPCSQCIKMANQRPSPGLPHATFCAWMRGEYQCQMAATLEGTVNASLYQR